MYTNWREKVFNTSDFEMTDYLGDWVDDVRITPTIDEIVDTIDAFYDNPENFEFDKAELLNALARFGYDEVDVGIFLSARYFENRGLLVRNA